MAGRGSPQADAHGLGALLLDGADSRTADAIDWDFLSKLGGSKFVRSSPSQSETSLTRSRLALSLPISNQAHVWQSSSAATEGLSL